MLHKFGALGYKLDPCLAGWVVMAAGLAESTLNRTDITIRQVQRLTTRVAALYYMDREAVFVKERIEHVHFIESQSLFVVQLIIIESFDIPFF